MNLQDCVGKTIAFDYPVHGRHTLDGDSRRVVEVENVKKGSNHWNPTALTVTGIERASPTLDQYRSFLSHKMKNVIVFLSHKIENVIVIS